MNGSMCRYCNLHVAIPCETMCEKRECFAAALRNEVECPKSNPVPEFPRKASDPVNQPIHYARWKMQPIEFIAANDLPFWFANVIKYCSRFDAKDGLQDLYKARTYLDMKIRQLEGKPVLG